MAGWPLAPSLKDVSHNTVTVTPSQALQQRRPGSQPPQIIVGHNTKSFTAPFAPKAEGNGGLPSSVLHHSTGSGEMAGGDGWGEIHHGLPTGANSRRRTELGKKTSLLFPFRYQRWLDVQARFKCHG